MTALAAGIGMVPLALASGSGAEILKPLATVIVGGMLQHRAHAVGAADAAYTVESRVSPGQRSAG